MRKLVIVGFVLAGIVFGGLMILKIGIGFYVKQNIRLAQQKYPGTEEDALIPYFASTRSTKPLSLLKREVLFHMPD
jgi:hypothetical protein